MRPEEKDDLIEMLLLHVRRIEELESNKRALEENLRVLRQRVLDLARPKQ